MHDVAAMPMKIDAFLPHLSTHENVGEKRRVETVEHGVPINTTCPGDKGHSLGFRIHCVPQVRFPFRWSHLDQFSQELLDTTSQRFQLPAARGFVKAAEYPYSPRLIGILENTPW